MNTYKRHRFPHLGGPPESSVMPSGSIIVSTSAIAGVPDHKINGKQHYLWRAVDQDVEVVDVSLQAQKFLGAHAAVSNLFNLGRHLVAAEHYRDLRVSAFSEWGRAAA